MYAGYTEGVAVPPPPTPVLPVFRGPVGVAGAGAGAGPSFQPGNSLVTVVEGGTAFLQCALRQRHDGSPSYCIITYYIVSINYACVVKKLPARPAR